MRKFLILSLLAATAAIPATVNAAVIMVDASTIQGANVLFNSGTQTGTTVTGSTQSGTIVNFTGLTVGGGTTISANGGQARIEGVSGLNMAGVTFNLAGGATFNNVEFNLFNGGNTSSSGAIATILVLGSSGTTYTFANNAIGNGSNFFGFVGTTGEVIKQVSYTVTGGGFVDQRQLRLDQQAPLPEPATWATMLMGLGLVGAAMRQTKKTANETVLAKA